MTIRINDAASASAHKFRKFRYDIVLTQVRRIRTASDNHISIYKETFPLDCNVLNSGLPFWIVIGVWRNINGDSLLIERYPSKRHIAFPTDHAADWFPRCFSNREIILIRISPYNTLRACGLQLSVYLIWPVRFKNDIAVVERSTNSVSLGKSKADVCLRFFGCLCELLELRISGDNRGIVVSFPVFSSLIASFSHAKTEIHSNRISRNKQFRENN